tara:strand:+ start:53 stop:364 length:312 start_codon:yes stop_codon:yes gene_type:complete
MDIGAAIIKAIERSLRESIEAQGGSISTTVTGLKINIPRTPNNTYSYQSTAKEQVPGYVKKDGSYVNGYERPVPPIHEWVGEPVVDGNIIGNALRQNLQRFIN